jgi:hypothetical protein
MGPRGHHLVVVDVKHNGDLIGHVQIPSGRSGGKYQKRDSRFQAFVCLKQNIDTLMLAKGAHEKKEIAVRTEGGSRLREGNLSQPVSQEGGNDLYGTRKT